MRRSVLVGCLLLGVTAVLVSSIIATRALRDQDRPATTAEKLVGTWKFVNSENYPPQPIHKQLTTYSRRGSVTVDIERGPRLPNHQSGTYEFDGEVLRVTIITRAKGELERYQE